MPKCDMKTRYLPATFAWILLLSTTILFFFYPCQYYTKSHPWVPAYQGVITFFVLANFTLATFMDPGVIPKASPDEDREEELRAPLYKNAEINGITVKMKWCVTCKFYRPPRCSHCSVCNHCIETFDHHCPWVNNCIGRRNYRFFFFFLVSLSIHMLSIFFLCLFYVLKTMPNIKHTSPIIAIALMIIVTVLAIPIFGLTGFHMVLVSRGRTTNEQVTGKFKGGYNPFSRGCWHNCCYTQFGPQYPSLLKPDKYAARRIMKENQSISTISNDRNNQQNGGNGSMRGNSQQSPHSLSHGYYDQRDQRHTQLSPGRDCSDTDMDPPQASQSQDCEPTPPLQRHDSTTFYLPQIENNLSNGNVMTGSGNCSGDADSSRHMRMYHPRHSPHARQRGLEPQRTFNPDVMSPDHHVFSNQNQSITTAQNRNGTATPTMQRIKPLGVATPLVMASPVRRSNPGTPTQPRRPDFIGLNQQQQHQAYYEFTPDLPPQHPQTPSVQQQQQMLLQQQRSILQQHQQHQQLQKQQTQQGKMPQHQQYAGSPQRRFLSEGELVRQGAGNELSYSRSNNTVDNIRELAGSPQRGMYLWKESSPGCSENSTIPNELQGSAGTVSNNMSHPQHIATAMGTINSNAGQHHPLIMTNSRMQQAPQDYSQASQLQQVSNYHRRSNPTSPTSQPSTSIGQQTHIVRYTPSMGYSPLVSNNSNTFGVSCSSGYQPQLRGGVPVFPPYPTQTSNSATNSLQPQPSPQIKRKQTPTRPISFVRALEMTDSMEMKTLEQQQQQQQQQQQLHQQQSQHQHPHHQQQQQQQMQLRKNPGMQSSVNTSSSIGNSVCTTSPTPERASVYDMNYEISV